MFVLINRHKHIIILEIKTLSCQSVCTQHSSVLAQSEGVTYSGRPFLLFGFPSGLVL